LVDKNNVNLLHYMKKILKSKLEEK